MVRSTTGIPTQETGHPIAREETQDRSAGPGLVEEPSSCDRGEREPRGGRVVGSHRQLGGNYLSEEALEDLRRERFLA
jgi:hypothetical protein